MEPAESRWQALAADLSNVERYSLLQAAEEGQAVDHGAKTKRKPRKWRNGSSTQPIAINKAPTRRSMERPSTDSFGDSVLLSGSPGYTIRVMCKLLGCAADAHFV